MIFIGSHSNKMIKTNYTFPSSENLEKQGQRLAQDLSLSMKTIQKQLDNINNSSSSNSLAGNDFTGTFSYTGGNQVYNFTYNHGLGRTPNGFICSNLSSNAGSSSYEHFTFVLLSWTDTQITVKLSYYAGVASSSGAFTIKVF